MDVHHLETRADGGAHEPDNLITVCSAHHRALHRGELTAKGCAATELRFSHADGAEYGASVSAPMADARARAFRGLRQLGFGEGEARRALELATIEAGDGAGLELLLRRALHALVRGRAGGAAA